MCAFFDKENELFHRAVSGDAAAREQLIVDNMHVAKQAAFLHMKGKKMSEDDKLEELQAAYELLVVGIDNMIKRGEMYNVKYLRNFLRLRLISYHREKVYGVDDGKRNRRDTNAMFNIRNPLSIDAPCYLTDTDRRDEDVPQFNPVMNFSDDFDVESFVCNKMIVGNMLSQLNDDERELITLLFYKGYTQCEVAKMRGVSQPLIAIQLKSILKKLLKKLKEMGVDYYEK